MQFLVTNSANTPDSGRPSNKKKQPYTPPKATVVTPDQAEEAVKAKAASRSQEFQSCSEVIAEARKRHVHGAHD